jgi:hypothetical protein
VKEQTSAHPEKSRDLLGRADTMMGAGLSDNAGRTAYLAGLHAAQAFIMETTGRVFLKCVGLKLGQMISSVYNVAPAKAGVQGNH